MEQRKTPKPATDREIRAITGLKADDELVMALRRTGATYDELLQASEWLDDDDYMGKNLKKTLSGTVRRVYELLLEHRDTPEER